MARASCGVLTVHPGTGAEQEPSWGMSESPWSSYSAYVTKVIFAEEGGQKVIAPLNCANLLASLKKAESIDLSGLDTSNVTNMSGMVSRCAALAELNLSGFDTSRVTDMSSVFSGCSSLAELDLTNFDTFRLTLHATEACFMRFQRPRKLREASNTQVDEATLLSDSEKSCVHRASSA